MLEALRRYKEPYESVVAVPKAAKAALSRPATRAKHVCEKRERVPEPRLLSCAFVSL